MTRRGARGMSASENLRSSSGIVGEGDDVGELLAGEVELLAEQRLLHHDHGLGASPHARDEVERIDLARRGRDVERRRARATDVVAGVAGHSAFEREQRARAPHQHRPSPVVSPVRVPYYGSN
jgi:hypothetical protein